MKIKEMNKTKKRIYFFNMYEMFKISAKTFPKNCVHTVKVNKTERKIINIQKNIDVKNIHNLADKEIRGKFKANNLTDE